DTHDPHRVVDDLFVQLRERLTSGLYGLAALKMLLADITDYFNRALPGAALETLQMFGVRPGTPFAGYLRTFCAGVASTVEKGSPLAPPS
ncbi:hypothetical protein, partial [Shewanella sp.]|uniref:hypothetical protein n=1 Tax=Shewanella sp. TaxID=50422 RepID=UPI00356A9ACB